jgi:hypothetical protein
LVPITNTDPKEATLNNEQLFRGGFLVYGIVALLRMLWRKTKKPYNKARPQPFVYPQKGEYLWLRFVVEPSLVVEN